MIQAERAQILNYEIKHLLGQNKYSFSIRKLPVPSRSTLMIISYFPVLRFMKAQIKLLPLISKITSSTFGA